MSKGESPEDQLARQRAELEQAVAALPDQAHAIWSYYSALVAEGFSESQAIYLVAISINDNSLEAP